MHPSLAGALDKTPFEQLLAHLAERRLRGALVLRPEGVEDLLLSDVVTIVDGMPAKIRTAESMERLGDLLLELGWIDDATHAEIERAIERHGGPLGELLVRAKRIDRSKLEHAVRVQLARKLVQLFSLPSSTRFAFYEGIDALAFYGASQLLPIDVSAVVLPGLRAHPSAAAQPTLERLGGAALRFKPGADLRGIELTPDERDLLGLLRVSPMNLEQLERAGVTDAEATRSLVYALLVLGTIESVEEGERASQPAAPQHKALQRISSAPVVRIALRRMSSSQNRIVVEEGGGDGREEVAPSSTQRRRIGSLTPLQDDPRRTELRVRAATLGGKSHHEVLGVAATATLDEIEAAFAASAARWHPDALPAELGDLRAECEHVWARIVEAHRALSHFARKRRTPV